MEVLENWCDRRGSLKDPGTHRLLVVLFGGLYSGSYRVIPKRNYFGAHGQFRVRYKATDRETVSSPSRNVLKS